ncbi:MAG: ABC transporter ATP-binding protein [Candidatus Kariarchaeaceae archaeon]|jgi:ABC-type multidrug transport system ATPase subunit
MTDILGLKITGLVKYFGEIKALDGIDLSIPEGHIVGLLGQNGAGKSTLVRLLSGVMKPTAGYAHVNGKHILSEVNEVKQITGLLPEEYALYEKLSIFEYIEFLGTLYDMNEEHIEIAFGKLAARLGLLPLRNRLIDTLSKGQKQKVAILAALVHEPLVLFLDEPLANLDVAAQIEVKQIIKEYKSQKRTIMIATHLLSNVEEVCDQIVIIDKGKILYSGELDSFKENHATLEQAYLSYIGNAT